MPRYFFHTENGVTFRDEVGTELHNLEAAMEEAALLHAELLRSADRIWDTGAFAAIVTDDKGLVLFRIDSLATLAPAVRRGA